MTLGLTLLLTVAILAIITGAIQVERIHRRSAGRQQCEQFNSILPPAESNRQRATADGGTVTKTEQ